MSYQFNTKELEKCSINQSVYDSLNSILSKDTNTISYHFFNSIMDILFEYTTLYRKKDFSLKNKKIDRIKECIFISIIYFNESIEEKSVDKFLVSIVILDFFSQDYSLLHIDKISTDFKKKILSLLNSLVIKINVPKDAPYSDKKMFNVFTEAKENKDYCKVIGIMDNLKYHSRMFDSIECSWKIIINFLFYLDSDYVVSFLLQETIFEKIEILLSNINIILSFQKIIKSSNSYLIIRSVKYFFDEIEKQLTHNNGLSKIDDYTEYLTLLFENKTLSFSNYIESLRLQYFQSYNYLFGWLLTKRSDFLPFYLAHVSFDERATKAFSFGFNTHRLDSDFEIVNEIESNFFKHEVKNYSPINFYTGFLELFTYNYAIQYKTRQSFLLELKKCSREIIMIQNSWEFSNLQRTWVKLFYLSLSIIHTNFSFTEEEIKTNIPVLYDERNAIHQDKESIIIMRYLLQNKSQYLKIKLVNGIDERIIEINKN